MVKLLGIDYGDARTGLAYSDDLGLIAIGAGCVKSYNPEKAADEIVKKAKDWNIGLMVLGKPINMNGIEGPRAQACKDFAQMLMARTDIPVVMIDERRTTVQAHEILTETGVFGKKRKGVVDSLAAEIILQTYMDKQKNI